MEINYGDMALSLQDAYSLLLKEVPIDHYHVYAHLSRLGYIVHRHVDSW